MSIPFGAIVYDATQVGVAPGKAMLLVRFSRRSSDGSYAGEEIATIHEAQACRLVRAALERGENGFWGSWFGLPESAPDSGNPLSQRERQYLGRFPGK